MSAASCSFHRASHRPPGSLPALEQGLQGWRNSCVAVPDYECGVCLHITIAGQRTYGTLISQSTHWNPSWMLNNDPRKESDLFSPVNNPFHRLESLTCRNTWAGLRFPRWGSLASTQSFCLLRRAAFGVVMWQSLSTHGAFLCLPSTCEADWLSRKLWSFLGKGSVTCKSKRKTDSDSEK